MLPWACSSLDVVKTRMWFREILQWYKALERNNYMEMDPPYSYILESLKKSLLLEKKITHYTNYTYSRLGNSYMRSLFMIILNANL